MARILVTGAGGFIGSHLVKRLVKLGHDVFSMLTPFEKTEELYLSMIKESTILSGDLRDRYSLDLAVRQSRPEIIFSLGALTSVAESFRCPCAYSETNILGTINLVGAAQKHGELERFIHTASPEMVKPSPKPYREDEYKPGLNSPYGLTKFHNYLYLKHVYEAYGFPSITVLPNNCYDEETEVLTREDFKPFMKLHGNEEFLTLNPRTRRIEYQNATCLVKRYYKGPMIRVKSRQFELLVTPNHNMWVRKIWSKRYELVEAARLLEHKGKRVWTFQLSADWIPNNQPEKFLLRKYKARKEWHVKGGKYVIPSEDHREVDLKYWVPFLGWYLSEGWCHKKYGELRIYNENPAYLTEIAELGRKLGFDPKIRGNRLVAIYDNGLAEYLRQFGTARHKFIPDFIKELPRELIQEFLTAYQKGDGYLTTHGGIVCGDGFISSSQQMLDDLQELCLKSGWGSSKKGKILTVARTCTEVCPRGDDNFTVEDYSGMIYCVEVPNHVLFVRRKGKGVFCGNTYHRKTSTRYVAEKVVTGILKGKLKLYGSPDDAIRNYTFIDDVVEGFIAVMEKGETGKTYHICRKDYYSIGQMVELAREALNEDAVVEWGFGAGRPIDPRCLLLDPTRTCNELGWEPKVPLREGIKHVADYWRGRVSTTPP